MSDAQRTAPRDSALDSWLRVATRRLGEQACRRIQDEIKEHYREAVEAGRAAGLAETAAEDAAIRGLGDPRAAGRRFRRTHLSRFDERLVADVCRKPPRLLFWVFLGVLAWASIVFSGILGSRVEYGSAVAVLLTMIGGMVAVFGIAPALARRGRARAATATGPLGYWVFFTSANVGTSLVHGKFQLVTITIHAAAFVVLTVLYIPLWIKLRNRDRGLA
jgi:hypothetical protein